MSQVAQTPLRSVIGRVDLDTMPSGREPVSEELRAVIDTPTEERGVSVDRMEIRDIALPEGMRRSMSRQAEAERDRRARVIVVEGEARPPPGSPTGPGNERFVRSVGHRADGSTFPSHGGSRQGALRALVP